MKNAFYLMLLSVSLFAVGCTKPAEQPATQPADTTTEGDAATEEGTTPTEPVVEEGAADATE